MIGICYTKDRATANHLADSAYEGFSKHYECVKVTKTNYQKFLPKCKFLVQVCYPNLHHYHTEKRPNHRKAHSFRNAIIDLGFLNKSIYLETGFLHSQVAYDLQKIKDHVAENLDQIYYAVGVSGLKGEATYCNQKSASDRFEQLGVSVQSHHQGQGNYILIVGQAQFGLSSWDINIRQWYVDIATQIKKHTKLPIVLRPHPKVVLNEREWLVERQFLNGNMHLFEWSRFARIEDAACVVSYSSNAAIDALVAGIPIIVRSKRNVAYPIAMHDIANVKKPTYPDNQTLYKFLFDLAYAQWTPAEIRTGIVAQRFAKIIDAHVHESLCYDQCTESKGNHQQVGK